MAIVRTCDVFCDLCTAWVDGATGKGIYQHLSRRARKNARDQGWRRVQLDGEYKDLCPTCWAKREKEA